MSTKKINFGEQCTIFLWILLAFLIKLPLILLSLTTTLPVQSGRDGIIYITIAKYGYTSWNIVFPPFYPLMIRLVSYLLPYDVSAYVISITFGLAAQYYFVRLVEFEELIPERYRIHLASIVFILGNFAWLHMSSVPSSEAPTMFFMLAAIYYVKTEKIAVSVVSIILGSLTRITFILFGPYFAYLFYQYRKNIYHVILSFTTGIGFVVHTLIGYILFGDLFILTDTQKKWGTYLVYPGYPLRLTYIFANRLMSYPEAATVVFLFFGFLYFMKSEYNLQGFFLVCFLLSLSGYAFWSYGFARQAIYILIHYYVLLKLLSFTEYRKRYAIPFILFVILIFIVNYYLAILHIIWMGDRP